MGKSTSRRSRGAHETHPAASRPGRPRTWFAFLALLIALGIAGWRMWPGRARADWLRTADQNVLLVTVDTLRADAVGCYGGRAVTPNLDRLAADGIRYAFAHAHAVVTLPSHASILTGRYPYDHGVRDNAGYRLADHFDTLAELAARRGLSTGAFVGAFPLDRRFGLTQGFDIYDDVGGREASQGDFSFTERPADEVVMRARAWIEQRPGPWFAWIHLFDPHAPYAPPAPFELDYAANPYHGEVAFVDHALGPLLDAVRRGTRLTTVVVTADHGEGLGDHGEVTHGTFAYESTLRVPLIIAQVGGKRPSKEGGRPGLLSDASARHVDIVPTIAELLGGPVPSNLPGRSLADGPGSDTASRSSYFEAMTPMLTHGWAPLRGIIVGRHKYIDLPIRELYNLDEDPGEQNNVAASPEGLAGQLSASLGMLDARLPGEPTAEDAEALRRLESLGYVSGSAPRKARYSEEDDPKRLIGLERMMLRALELHRGGRSSEAVVIYRDVIARRPDMKLAYRRMASIQWQSGAPKEAIATLRAGLQRNGPDIESEIRLGTYLAETGAPEEAVVLLEGVTRAFPDSAEALNGLGIAHARLGRSDEALQAFRRALAVDPRDAFALENIGTVHLQRGDLEAADKAFRRAVAHDPRSSRAEAGLGVVALRTGRRTEAIDHWRRAVTWDRTNFDALYNLGTELAAAGRVVEAVPYLEQFVRTAPRGFYGPDVDRVARMLTTLRRGEG